MPESLISQGAVLGSANATESLGVSGYGGVAFQIQGTFSGTITFEASLGSEWVAMRVTASNSSTPVTTATATGVYIGSAVGFSAVRARMSSYSSGGAHILIRSDLASPGGAGGGGGSGTDVNLIEVGGVPVALGQTTMSASIPVTMASDQGAIDVNITGGGGSGGTSSTFGAAFPATGTAIGVSDPGGTMEPLSAETLDFDTGGGTALTTVIGIALPASGGPVAGGTNTNPIQVGDAGGSLTVDGTVAATQSGTWNITNVSGTVSLPTGAATAALQTQPGVDIGDVTVNNASGASAVNIQDGGNSITVDGTVTVSQGTAANLNATVVGTGTFATQSMVTGNVADGSAASGNPVMTAGIAKSPDGTTPGTTAEDNVARMTTDLNRRHYVNPVSATNVKAHFDGSSAYTDQQIAAAPGSGKQTVITFISVSTGAATALNFFIEEGSTKIFGPIYLEAVAGRGYVSGPMSLPVTANTAVTFTTSANIAQAIDIQYFTQDV